MVGEHTTTNAKKTLFQGNKICLSWIINVWIK